MAMRPTLSLFPTCDPAGTILCKEFARLARELGFAVHECFEPTVRDYTYACWNDDVVVLDATLTGGSGQNYDLAIPVPFDHVLVVSRSYLPINFYGLRDAIFDRDTKTLIYGTPFYPNSLSNEEILRWLYLQLEDLLPSLPRPEQEKGLIRSVLRGMGKSLNSVDERRKQYGQIFISYRSTDWAQVEELKRRIEAGEFHSGESKAVRCLPPNTLSDEVMTEQRRWQILSMIDRFMSPADEVWAYESENYYDSWWTLGELMTLAYRSETGYRNRRPPKLLIFDSKENRPRDVPENYLPTMTKPQRRRMARWFANCDTAQMGVESIAAMRLLAHVPLLGRCNYFRDHVWSDEFWRHPIFDCKACRRIGKRKNRLDIESFLWMRDPGFFRIIPQEIQEWVERGLIICPGCGSSYQLQQGPPHYLWMPVANWNRTGTYVAAIFDIELAGPESPSILPLPTYRIV